jgi:hypothetical protein
MVGSSPVARCSRRREFFRATPHEVREHLLALTGELLQFEELPEALEYHQSVTEADSLAGAEGGVA